VNTQSLSLCEKYRPLNIADFIGLTEPKLMLQKIAANPHGRVLLFEGKSGSGKTAMALALASEIPAQVHVLPAHECTRDNLAKLWISCQAKPKAGFRKRCDFIGVPPCILRAVRSGPNRGDARNECLDLDLCRDYAGRGRNDLQSWGRVFCECFQRVGVIRGWPGS
jgi:hypothetical protein